MDVETREGQIEPFVSFCSETPSARLLVSGLNIVVDDVFDEFLSSTLIGVGFALFKHVRFQ